LSSKASMSPVQRCIDRLEEAKAKAATESLDPTDSEKTEFGFGKACGIQRGLRIARDIIEAVLSESDQDHDNRTKNRSR
jgi:hypothetical protein